jgi:hypothetical protein
MTDPTIRAALDEASGAVFDLRAANPAATVEQASAVAIAAFLRALDLHVVDISPGGHVCFWSKTAARIVAAAVEAAAKEGRDD